MQRSRIPGRRREPGTDPGAAQSGQHNWRIQALERRTRKLKLRCSVSARQRSLPAVRTPHRKRDAAATDLSGKRILEYLVHVETGHEMMLKSELEAYRQDKDWYMGVTRTEMTHAGP